MSVIITGMDIPKNCSECKYKGNCESIDYEADIIDLGARQEHCPVKTVSGLIDKIKIYRELPVKQVIEIIKEYCGEEKDSRK